MSARDFDLDRQVHQAVGGTGGSDLPAYSADLTVAARAVSVLRNCKSGLRLTLDQGLDGVWSASLRLGEMTRAQAVDNTPAKATCKAVLAYCQIPIEETRLLVAGSRSIQAYVKFAAQLDAFMSSVGPATIISGHGNHADGYGEIYARERGIPCQVIKPDWTRHGKSAGYRRQYSAITYADHVVVFWDGKKDEVACLIKLAADNGVPITVYKVDPSTAEPPVILTA